MSYDRRTVLRAGLVATGFGLAGCTGGESTTSRTPVATDAVSLVDNAFEPVRITVSAGTTVTWTNDGSTDHDVTAASFHDSTQDWSFEATLAPDEAATHTFEETGVYEYRCTIHGEGTMCGLVQVGDDPLESPLPCESDEGGVDVSY